MSSPARPLHVAIIGGGLCGLALATALRKHSISFTLYESRSSFTEIGAGINVGPNGISSLRLIKPSLGEKVYSLATRNPPPDEDTWMWFRYGAASGAHEDGEVIMKLYAPGTGSLTLHRQEFLGALAAEIGEGNAMFSKKFVSYEQNPDEDFVRIKFADGTEEKASVLVGCDGIHSRVRANMFGDDNPVSKPHFNHDGAYRAVVPIKNAIEALGESALQAQVLFGPNGYIIYYPVNGGTAVNCGAWIRKREDWKHDEWVIQDQGEAFRHDMQGWGPRVQRLLQYFDSSPAFWSAHQHTQQPQTFTDGRVILIGDGAHSMPPHQGAGSSQAVEDAYVLSEVLASLDQYSTTTAITAALQITNEIRQPRFAMVQQFSTDSGPLWYSFYEQHLEGDERQSWLDDLQSRLEQIWGVDMSQEAQRAKQLLEELLSQHKLLNGSKYEE